MFQFTIYGHECISESIDSNNRNFSFAGLANLDTYNSSLTRAKNAKQKTMEYLSF